MAVRADDRQVGDAGVESARDRRGSAGRRATAGRDGVRAVAPSTVSSAADARSARALASTARRASSTAFSSVAKSRLSSTARRCARIAARAAAGSRALKRVDDGACAPRRPASHWRCAPSHAGARLRARCSAGPKSRSTVSHDRRSCASPVQSRGGRRGRPFVPSGSWFSARSDRTSASISASSSSVICVAASAAASPSNSKRASVSSKAVMLKPGMSPARQGAGHRRPSRCEPRPAPAPPAR